MLSTCQDHSGSYFTSPKQTEDFQNRSRLRHQPRFDHVAALKTLASEGQSSTGHTAKKKRQLATYAGMLLMALACSLWREGEAARSSSCGQEKKSYQMNTSCTSTRRGLWSSRYVSVAKFTGTVLMPSKSPLKASCNTCICLKSGSGCFFEAHWCDTKAALPEPSKTVRSPWAFDRVHSFGDSGGRGGGRWGPPPREPSALRHKKDRLHETV